MFNLQGAGQQTKTTHQVDPSHQEYLQQAFTSVLAQQIADNEGLIRDTMVQQREHEEEIAQKRSQQQNKDSSDESEGSSDIDFGDDDDELINRLQLQRKQQMVHQNNEITTWKAKGHGGYDLITQSDFLPTVTSPQHQHCIVHFFHRDFERCKIIDKHLALLAPNYLPVKIVRIDAEKTPFFVDKLSISILPTIVLFKDGKVVDRLTGFEELGGQDTFTTKQIEQRLKKSGIMLQIKSAAGADIETLHADEKRNQRGAGMFSIGGQFGAGDLEDMDEFRE